MPMIGCGLQIIERKHKLMEITAHQSDDCFAQDGKEALSFLPPSLPPQAHFQPCLPLFDARAPLPSSSPSGLLAPSPRRQDSPTACRSQKPDSLVPPSPNGKVPKASQTLPAPQPPERQALASTLPASLQNSILQRPSKKACKVRRELEDALGRGKCVKTAGSRCSF